MNNLGVPLFPNGEGEKAKPLLEKVVEIRKERLGVFHPDYALSFTIKRVGMLTAESSIVPKRLYANAIEIFRNGLGESHPHYATSILAFAL